MSKRNMHFGPKAILMFGVSSLTLLSGCDFAEIRNPFNPERPPQEVEGERRQPVFNQRMITKIRQASGVDYGYDDTSGIPDIPAELLQDDPLMPMRSDNEVSTQGESFFSGWFEDDTPKPYTLRKPEAQSAPMDTTPQQWATQTPPAAETFQAQPVARNTNYPSFGTVPPRPEEFETARSKAAAHINALKQDYQSVQTARAELYGEPTQQAIAQPVEMPQLPKPQVKVVQTPVLTPAIAQDNKIAGTIGAPAMQAEVIDVPQQQLQPQPQPIYESQPYLDEGNLPRRGVDIMTQEEWIEYIRGGEIIEGDMPAMPIANAQNARFPSDMSAENTPQPAYANKPANNAPVFENRPAFEQPTYQQQPVPYQQNRPVMQPEEYMLPPPQIGPQSSRDALQDGNISGVAAGGSGSFLAGIFSDDRPNLPPAQHAQLMASNLQKLAEKKTVNSSNTQHSVTETTDSWPKLAPSYAVKDAIEQSRQYLIDDVAKLMPSASKKDEHSEDAQLSTKKNRDSADAPMDWLGALINKKEEKTSDPLTADAVTPDAVTLASEGAAHLPALDGSNKTITLPRFPEEGIPDYTQGGPVVLGSIKSNLPLNASKEQAQIDTVPARATKSEAPIMQTQKPAGRYDPASDAFVQPARKNKEMKDAAAVKQLAERVSPIPKSLPDTHVAVEAVQNELQLEQQEQQTVRRVQQEIAISKPQQAQTVKDAPTFSQWVDNLFGSETPAAPDVAYEKALVSDMLNTPPSEVVAQEIAAPRKNPAPVVQKITDVNAPVETMTRAAQQETAILADALQQIVIDETTTRAAEPEVIAKAVQQTENKAVRAIEAPINNPEQTAVTKAVNKDASQTVMDVAIKEKEALDIPSQRTAQALLKQQNDVEQAAQQMEQSASIVPATEKMAAEQPAADSSNFFTRLFSGSNDSPLASDAQEKPALQTAVTTAAPEPQSIQEAKKTNMQPEKSVTQDVAPSDAETKNAVTAKIDTEKEIAALNEQTTKNTAATQMPHSLPKLPSAEKQESKKIAAIATPPVMQVAAPVPEVQVEGQTPTAENAGLPEQGALPSPKILQEFKMLPPSRYDARMRADSKKP